MMEALGLDQSLSPLFFFSAAIAVIIFLSLLLVALYYYYKRRIRAAVKDAEDIADLAAIRNEYASEIEHARDWKERAQEELLKLVGERELQERLRQELQELEIKKAEAEQDADDARKEVLDLQRAVTALAEERDNLTKDVESARTAREDVSELLEQKRAAEDSVLEAKQEIDEFRAQLEQIRSEAEEIRRQKAAMEADLSTFETRQGSLQNEIDRLNSELVSKREEANKFEDDLAPKREQVRELMRLEAQMKELHSEIGELEQERSALQISRGSEASLAQYADLIEVEPRCLIADVFPRGDLGQISEEVALEHVAQHLKSQSLIFSPRILNAFHTCMKVSDISPITVLAGISGTGKSELPLRYAEAMGMHALSIAVQPSWSSPQDLFGFYNYLEKRYKATELARSLVRMDPYNFSGSDEAFQRVREESRADRMLLVLIDEMNLARVEYYFSEFLSKLEARRAVLSPEDHVSRAPAEIEIEGARQSSDEALATSAGIRLWVGKNVLFAGTMNEDESTQTLSDKVLDRSNVLRFGKPPSSSGIATDRSDEHKRDKYLTQDVWQGWIRPVQDHRWRREVDDWIESLNDALELIGRPFGWRVREAIRQYIANYPGIDGQNIYKTAMADQVEQKVIPKLRGSDINQSQDALNAVERVLDQLQDDELSEAFRACKQETMYGTFNWRGVTRV